MAGLEEWSSLPKLAAKAAEAEQNSAYGSLRSFCVLIRLRTSTYETHRSRAARRSAWQRLSSLSRRPARFGRVRPKGASRSSSRRRSASTSRSRSWSSPQHPVPRAKFPVIDIHSHQPTPISPAEFDRVMKGMEANNLQILVNLSGSSGDRLRQGVDALQSQQVQGPDGAVRQHQLRRPGRPRLRRESGQAARGRYQGRRDGAEDLQGPRHVRHGRPTASRLQVDDPELDPVWETCARLQRAGADPHRRAAGVLRAARLHQRALARAVALSAIAATRPACASSS